MASATLTLFTNGYVYPKEHSNGFGSISSSGLNAWTDISGVTRVYFYPQHTGHISVAIKARSSGNDTLRLSLNGSPTAAHDVVVPTSSSFTLLDVGTYNIATIQYHYLEIRAATKHSTYLPDVEALEISGAAAVGLKYNRSSYRGAPATHLTYETAAIQENITGFYSEIYVGQDEDPVNAYYMTNGFDGGYFGIQVNSSTERRVLFSIWSSYDTQDPKQIPDEYKVRLVKKGANVITGEFGNEGSGAQSYLKYMWKTDTVYKLLVKTQASGQDNTIYTGYFHTPESGWQLIAEWNKPKTSAKQLSDLYSFVENWASNGNDFFKARYGNQWAHTEENGWAELTKASFSTTACENGHQRYDYGGGADGTWMYMYTGGFKQTSNLTPGSEVVRAPTGTPPQVDFTKLPVA